MSILRILRLKVTDMSSRWDEGFWGTDGYQHIVPSGQERESVMACYQYFVPSGQGKRSGLWVTNMSFSWVKDGGDWLWVTGNCTVGTKDFGELMVTNILSLWDKRGRA